jgi:membrane-bound lytic murein transglycosylase B
MPSSFLLYAQDFDGDGKRDIWKSTPDVFASIANYLAAHGWNKGQTWGPAKSRSRATCSEGLAEARPLQTVAVISRRQMTVPLPLANVEECSGCDVAAGRCRRPTSRRRSCRGQRHFLSIPTTRRSSTYNCVNAYGLSVGLLGDRAMQAPPAKAPRRATR